jgi:hypothetical protein
LVLGLRFGSVPSFGLFLCLVLGLAFGFGFAPSFGLFLCLVLGLAFGFGFAPSFGLVLSKWKNKVDAPPEDVNFLGS